MTLAKSGVQVGVVGSLLEGIPGIGCCHYLNDNFQKIKNKIAFRFKVLTLYFKLTRINTFNSTCFDKYKPLINVWFLGFNSFLKVYFSPEVEVREFLCKVHF